MNSNNEIINKLYAFRQSLKDKGLSKFNDEIDKDLSEIIEKVSEHIDYYELLKAGVNEILKLNDLMVEGNIENPIAFGVKVQKIRTYILDALYKRKSRFVMQLSGAED
jgi:CRISPR/Cas system-associated endonuclease Cas3-HD